MQKYCSKVLLDILVIDSETTQFWQQNNINSVILLNSFGTFECKDMADILERIKTAF